MCDSGGGGGSVSGFGCGARDGPGLLGSGPFDEATGGRVFEAPGDAVGIEDAEAALGEAVDGVPGVIGGGGGADGLAERFAWAEPLCEPCDAFGDVVEGVFLAAELFHEVEVAADDAALFVFGGVGVVIGGAGVADGGLCLPALAEEPRGGERASSDHDAVASGALHHLDAGGG